MKLLETIGLMWLAYCITMVLEAAVGGFWTVVIWLIIAALVFFWNMHKVALE